MTLSPTAPSPTIGLVMDFFNPDLLNGALDYCQENNLQLDARWSVRGDWLPRGLNWQGILHGLVDDPAATERIHHTALPEIALVENEGRTSVLPDYKKAGRMAAEELDNDQIKHLLTVLIKRTLIDIQFTKGAVEYAEAHNLPHSQHLWSNSNFKEMISTVVEKIIGLPKPLGLCIAHASTAYSIINALHRAGFRVPEDVRIVVIDKDPQRTPSLAPVSMTTVKLNEWHRGFVAAQMLHESMLGAPTHKKINLIAPLTIHGRASTGHSETQDLAIAKALTFLRKNYHRGINVSDVVTASGSSRRTLETRFSESLNRGIQEELRRIRIEHAQYHLHEGDLSITEIASRCGFSSLHYFSRCFKNETGLSPREFQKSTSS